MKAVFAPALAGLIASSLLSTPAQSQTKVLKFAGGPGAVAALKKQLPAIESATGLKIEVIEQGADQGVAAMNKGFVDGISDGLNAEEVAALPAAKELKLKANDFEMQKYGESRIYAVVHPDNPVTSLNRQQITDLLSGKDKTWEPVNGRKDAVKIFFNKQQKATVQRIPRFYLNSEEVPGANYVTNLPGLSNNLKENPGALAFSGSKFDNGTFKPKFLDSDVAIEYRLIAKKPLSPEMQKIFAFFKK